MVDYKKIAHNLADVLMLAWGFLMVWCIMLGVFLPGRAFYLLANRPGLANRSFQEQVEYGTEYEYFKAVIGWRQISMSDVVQLARFGTKEDIEPYVDYVTWLNADKDEFQRNQLIEAGHDILRANYDDDAIYGMWNWASVANCKWAALHCRLGPECKIWDKYLANFYEWFALRETITVVLTRAFT